MTGVPLAPLTTLRLGGPADRLVEAHTEAELIEAVERDPALILAGGSNVVIADDGVHGTVVHVLTRGIGHEGELLVVQAGEPWDAVVEHCVGHGLQGFECLSGIPGSTGATPIQNVGAYGQEVSETVEWVRVYDRATRRVETMAASECGFDYRTSVFKYHDRRVVLAVAFRLHRGALSGPLRYAELAARSTSRSAGGRPCRAVREAVLRLRRGKGMVIDPSDPDSVSAGSFFTNPILDRRGVRRRCPASRPRCPEPDGRIKTSAAWLIERSGFGRGHGDGRAGISTQAHARARQPRRRHDGRAARARARDRRRRARHVRRRAASRAGSGRDCLAIALALRQPVWWADPVRGCCALAVAALALPPNYVNFESDYPSPLFDATTVAGVQRLPAINTTPPGQNHILQTLCQPTLRLTFAHPQASVELFAKAIGDSPQLTATAHTPGSDVSEHGRQRGNLDSRSCSPRRAAPRRSRRSTCARPTMTSRSTRWRSRRSRSRTPRSSLVPIRARPPRPPRSPSPPTSTRAPSAARSTRPRSAAAGRSAGSASAVTRSRRPPSTTTARPTRRRRAYSWTVVVPPPRTEATLQGASVVFSSPDNAAGFQCSIDGGAFVACSSPFAPGGAGAHTVVVRAVGADGQVDTSGMTVRVPADNDHDNIPDADEKLPLADHAPEVGETAIAQHDGGTVLVQLPGEKTFLPFTGAASLPVGSVVDATKGTLTLTVASNGYATTDRRYRAATVTLSGGLFEILQARMRRGVTRVVQIPVEFVLKSAPGAELPCRRAAPSKGVVRTLTAIGKGVFRVTGGASRADVRTASFTTTDRCNGTRDARRQGPRDAEQEEGRPQGGRSRGAPLLRERCGCSQPRRVAGAPDRRLPCGRECVRVKDRMPPFRPCLAALFAAAALTAAPAVAAAAPPVNDNYLASTSLNAIGTAMPLETKFDVDTTEATTQTDLFSVDAAGMPLGGGPPEDTSCGSTSYGKTVWYDFHPKVSGGVYISAIGSYDAVLRLYEWRLSDARITSTIQCANDTPAPQQLLLADVKAGHHYTVQLGGAGASGGATSFELDFFPDTDGDGILDEGSPKDACPTTPGIARESGCPPDLKVTPALNFDRVGGGIRITSLVVNSVPKGAKVVARGGGASQTIKATKTGKVTLTKLIGRTARAGSAVEVRVTMGPTGSGKYKYGAFGAYFKWPVNASGLGTRVSRCMTVKTNKIQKTCS